jgi:hypothetical protein
MGYLELGISDFGFRIIPQWFHRATIDDKQDAQVLLPQMCHDKSR